MDMVTLALAKKFAKQVAAGFSSVSVEGTTIHFTLNDGTKTSVTIPEPDCWAFMNDITIDDDGTLVISLTRDVETDKYYTKEEVDAMIKEIYPVLRAVLPNEKK